MYIIPNQVNLAIVPSQISPVWDLAAILIKWPLRHHFSATKRGTRAIIVDSVYRFSGAQIADKSIADYIMPFCPPFWRPFKQNGGHLQSSWSISETKSRRAFNPDPMSRFCGA